ncbi:putative GTPase activating protein for Arf-domain-containing protein, partial [Lineolata rhizophorae]
MVSVLNKRQQARNERALQDLIRSVPGNDRCADCAAKNPAGWASWSLGIFLCMRCAALHRKLGTHISKVKSLSMDTWNNDQVENMRRIGNTESNRKFNPTNVKPAMPIDVDEVDGVMERFIRQKYEQRIFQSPNPRPNVRNNTGSTSSDERPGPPLPPKPTKRFNFGLRTTSSTFPSSKSDERSPPVSPGLGGFGREPSPPRVNKPSRVFGSTVGSSDMDITSKLSSLREMGFPDDKRNAQILRGHNGNLERTVESLIRLGEKSHTPVASNPASTNGITIEKARPPPPAKSATNPFDMLDAQQQQQQPAQPSPPQHQHQQQSYNPF